ncbi:MAG: hypothetical protein ACXADY_26180 [Candidatus Hodarchaeales archaeon]|jgi:hypothetical protein
MKLPPTMSGDEISEKNKDVLMMLYQEVGKSWRDLLGVRFKLLALVPGVSLAVLFSLFGEGLLKTTIGFNILISMFGLVVTFGIYMYEVRNSEIYYFLLRRGKKIEQELGIINGQFQGRPKGEKKLFTITFYHDTAIKLLYWPTLITWCLSLLYFVFSLISDILS